MTVTFSALAHGDAFKFLDGPTATIFTKTGPFTFANGDGKNVPLDKPKTTKVLPLLKHWLWD